MAIGDWLLDGKRHYGDGLYKRAAEITGLAANVLEHYASLSRCFELCLRKQDLSYSHHKEVASLKLIDEDAKGKLYLSDEPDQEKIGGLLDKAAAMQHYAERLKAGILIERPIAIGVLKIKAKLGELMPAGKGGRGMKNPHTPCEGFHANTVSAFRKLAANKDRLQEYCDAAEDVPSQAEFLRYVASDGTLCAKHGNGVIEWYTPEKYVSAGRYRLTRADMGTAGRQNDHTPRKTGGRVWPSFRRKSKNSKVLHGVCEELFGTPQNGKICRFAPRDRLTVSWPSRFFSGRKPGVLRFLLPGRIIANVKSQSATSGPKAN